MITIYELINNSINNPSFNMALIMIFMTAICAFLNVKLGAWAGRRWPNRVNKFDAEIFTGRLTGSILSLLVLALCSSVRYLVPLVDIYTIYLALYMINEIDSALSIFGVDLKLLKSFSQKAIDLLNCNAVKRIKDFINRKFKRASASQSK